MRTRIRKIQDEFDLFEINNFEHSFPSEKLVVGPNVISLCCLAETLSRDEVVGYILAKRHKQDFEIKRLLVHPNHRKKGIGSELVKAIEELTNDIRPHLVMRVSEYSDLGIMRFLSKCGLKAVKTDRNGNIVFVKSIDDCVGV